jgi:hypothetical protein
LNKEGILSMSDHTEETKKTEAEQEQQPEPQTVLDETAKDNIVETKSSEIAQGEQTIRQDIAISKATNVLDATTAVNQEVNNTMKEEVPVDNTTVDQASKETENKQLGGTEEQKPVGPEDAKNQPEESKPEEAQQNKSIEQDKGQSSPEKTTPSPEAQSENTNIGQTDHNQARNHDANNPEKPTQPLKTNTNESLDTTIESQADTSNPKSPPKSPQSSSKEQKAPESDAKQEKPQTAQSTEAKPQPVSPSEPKQATTDQAKPTPSPAPAPAPTPTNPNLAKPKTSIVPKSELLRWSKLSKTLPANITTLEKEKEELTTEKSNLLEKIKKFDERRKQETDQLKKSEQQLKEKLEELEQRNKSLVDMIDQAENFTPMNVQKEKQAEAGREILKKQLKERTDELSVYQDRYRSEYLIDREIGNLKCQNEEMNRQIQRLEETVVQMKRREQEAKEKALKEGTDPESRKKTEAELQVMTKALEKAIAGFDKANSELQAEEAITLRLSKEVEELQSKEKQHEITLDTETKTSREEAVRIRKDLAGREHRFKENERANEELRKKVQRLELQIKEIAEQLKAGSSVNRVAVAKKVADKTDRKMAESLVNEVKVLKSESDRIKREKGRLEVMIRDLTENLNLRAKTLSVLSQRLADLDFDKTEVESILFPEERVASFYTLPRMSELELKKVMERVMLENIHYKKRLLVLERQASTAINSSKSN